MTILLFPGQGTQRVGMGSVLFKCFSEAQQVVSQASLEAGIDVASLLRHGPPKILARTMYAQIAVTTVNIAALQIVRRCGTVYDAVAGHSVGVIAALVAADMLTPAEAIKLAACRGAIMNGIPGDGAMMSVTGIPPGTAQEVLRGISSRLRLPLVVGLVNGPLNVVISGAADAVACAARELREAGALSVRPLDVSHAFHSPLMAPARRAWQDAVNAQHFREARVPVVADTSGNPLTQPREVREFLIDQLTAQVRWDLVCDYLTASRQCEAIEVGDSTALRSLGRAYEHLHIASMASGLLLERLRSMHARTRDLAAESCETQLMEQPA
jgi:[acyl-carrier-protein] S-malonyltransferase